MDPALSPNVFMPSADQGDIVSGNVSPGVNQSILKPEPVTSIAAGINVQPAVNNPPLPPPPPASVAPPTSIPMMPADPNYHIPQPPVSEARQPIYFSDGVLYPEDLNANTSNANNSNNSLDIALPGELVEVYNNLGILGRLLATGSVATIRFLHAVRNFSENLTEMFGITSPKFEHEINMHRQMLQEEEQKKHNLQQMYSTWQAAPGGPPVGQPGPSGMAAQMMAPPLPSHPMPAAQEPVAYMQVPPPMQSLPASSIPVAMAPPPPPTQFAQTPAAMIASHETGTHPPSSQ